MNENSDKLDTPLPKRKISTPNRNGRGLDSPSPNKSHNLYGSIEKREVRNASTKKIESKKDIGVKLPMIMKLHSMDLS